MQYLALRKIIAYGFMAIPQVPLLPQINERSKQLQINTRMCVMGYLKLFFLSLSSNNFDLKTLFVSFCHIKLYKANLCKTSLAQRRSGFLFIIWKHKTTVILTNCAPSISVLNTFPWTYIRGIAVKEVWTRQPNSHSAKSHSCPFKSSLKLNVTCSQPGTAVMGLNSEYCCSLLYQITIV